ncbi:MAG: NAD(P)/FAD-dependent oxidoreductase [Pigmentiphaga sp.]
MNHKHRVVIVGGGAGGLELAVKLGRAYGESHVTLVDKAPFHIWKPSLHEVAAGTLDIHREGLSYPMLAHDHGFRFVPGAMTAVDRERQTVSVAPLLDEDGEEILPARSLPYDTLVLAIGSHGNFFNTPGAEAYALSLDSTEAAERFRRALLKITTRLDAQPDGQGSAHVLIVGGGATGVELAAELLEASQVLSNYGASHASIPRLHIRLLEGGPRVLAPLPERISAAATKLLTKRGASVITDCRVTEVTPNTVITNQQVYPADLCIWAAGIKAPGVLTTLGLETNRLNQVIVNEQLQTADPRVFALGDCAAVDWAGTDNKVPARAQAAHQMSNYLFKVMKARIDGSPMPAEAFAYRDFGSLVSLGHAQGVGTLMGSLQGRNFFVEGVVARVMYSSLRWSHHAVVLGRIGACIRALSGFLAKRSRPRVKLH